MERTQARQNKRVLLNTFKSTTVERYNIVHQYGKQEGMERYNKERNLMTVVFYEHIQ